MLLQCASAVDKLATFYFIDIVTGESPSSPAALCLAQHITNCPGLFQEVSLLHTCVNILILHQVSNATRRFFFFFNIFFLILRERGMKW